MFVITAIFVVGVFGAIAWALIRESNKMEANRSGNRDYLNLTKDEFLKKQQAFQLNFVKDTEERFQGLAQELEDAYPLDYQVNIYNRLCRETRHSQETILQLMFEQKRFLLMASILKKVPMFSSEVDEVWHQQLMFTNEYKAFTESFAGQFIHHAPNVSGTDGKDDRFFFDMMYKKFFKEKDFSAQIWGAPFYQSKPSSTFISYWEHIDIPELEEKYFFDRKSLRSLNRELIREIKEDIQKSYKSLYTTEFLKKESRIRLSTDPKQNPANDLTLPYVFWVSMDDSLSYTASLGLEQEVAKQAKSSQDSGFFGGGGFFDNHKNGNDSHDSGSSHWGGGSDSGGSGGGGSSCGSSCGSS